MLGSLSSGRGSENVLFNLLRYKPDDIKISIVETDFIDQQRISPDELEEITSNVKLIRIHRNYHKYNNIFDLFKIFIIYGIPFFSDLKDLNNKEKLFEIRNTDLVYLFFNPYSIFFYNLKIPIIGSTHAMKIDNRLTSKMKNKFYSLLYCKNINGFHAFPKYKYILNNPKFKYKMELSNGVNTSLYYPDYNVNNKKIKFLFVAALVRDKGLDILLPLIDKFKNNNEIEFHIAGTGPLVNEIKKRNNIIYHGVVNNDELSKLYRESDVFVYPSHNDSYSMVTLEALSSGLYVLCSDYLKGNFDDFENKYLEYLPLNVDSFYNRINDIIKNRDIIRHDKESEYNYIKNNYSWEIISRKFYDYMIKFYNESKEIWP